MAHSIGVNNPFLRPPGPGAAETAARGAFYGAKIRTGAIASGKSTPSEPKLYWVYGKKTWANCNGLGFPPGKINNTTTGLLSLYSPRSNLPLMPVLTGVDTSNEGAMGSVIKATVSFTMYPSLTESGVAIERIQSSFFKPGATVSCQFGWSTYAAIACASRFGFSGKVVSFSWSVNTDVSISASTSVIAPGSVATGVSTNMQQKSPGPPFAEKGADGKPKAPNVNENGGEVAPSNPLDPKQVKVAAADLGTAIDNVMAEFNPIQSRELGQNGSGSTNGTGNSGTPTTPPAGKKEEIYGIGAWIIGETTSKYGLRFCSVGIPWMPEPPETDEITNKDEAYAAEVTGGGAEEGEQVDEDKKKKEEEKKIQDQINKLNTQGAAGEKPKPIVKKFWYVQFGSMEAYLSPLISSATDNNIRKVDIANFTSGPPGPKDYISAYPMEVLWPGCDYGGGKPNVAEDRTPIGSIWFNTDFMKETWRKYFNENSTNTSQKKLTSFLTELGKRANEAAGDFWHLSCTVVEKFSSCGSIGGRTSVLSVEDFSFCPNVGAFNFNASFGRPMLKNVSVSCKSSSTMGAAVMGGGNVDTPGKPGVTHGTNPNGFITQLRDQVKDTGINTAWGDAMKAVLKLKKKADADHHSKKNILFPIDFSVTIDGCSGWQFNEAVNTNVKPPGYGGSKFAISGISNKIDASTWETSLTAMMRAG